MNSPTARMVSSLVRQPVPVFSRSRLYHGHSPGGQPTPDGSAGLSATMAASRSKLRQRASCIGPTSSSTDRATSTSARMESCCTPPEQSLTAVRFAIVPQSLIAISALSKCFAALTRLRGRFLVIFMGRPRCRPRTGQNRGFRTIAPGAQKGRDVFCSHEANLQTRPTSTARLKWGQRRGAVDRNRAEPAASRQVPLPTATN